jgi:hypothetical protein
LCTTPLAFGRAQTKRHIVENGIKVVRAVHKGRSKANRILRQNDFASSEFLALKEHARDVALSMEPHQGESNAEFPLPSLSDHGWSGSGRVTVRKAGLGEQLH